MISVGDEKVVYNFALSLVFCFGKEWRTNGVFTNKHCGAESTSHAQTISRADV